MSRVAAICLTMMFGAAGGLTAGAADLPKEGKFSVTFFATGTSKGVAVGKTRYQSSFEYDGFTVGEGLLDHVTFHCTGMNGRRDQTRHVVNFCVLTDKDGDQIAQDIEESFPNGTKIIRGTGKLVAGTGKYEGISGEFEFENQGSGFRAGTDDRFFNYGKTEGQYQLPK